MKAVLYIHGRGGSAAEAEHYKALFPDCFVTGLDYQSATPWDAGKEIKEAVMKLKKQYGGITLIANSIGAFFALHSGAGLLTDKAFFISPVIDMEKLISGMMLQVGVTEDELKEKGTVITKSGETLSWDYLTYVRENPVNWSGPAEILYGSGDNLTDIETVKAFAKRINAKLTVMEGGEHWFHTQEQMAFLDKWIINNQDKEKTKMNEIIKAMEERRSIRKFRPDIPAKEQIDEILNAGLYAANGRGMQAAIAIVVTNKEQRDKLADINRRIGGWAEGFDPFYGAPVIIIVLADKSCPTYIYDGSLMMGNLMLAAHSLGLGSIWIHRAKEEFEMPEYKAMLKELGIEGEWEGIGHCALGFIDGDMPAAAGRKDGRIYRID